MNRIYHVGVTGQIWILAQGTGLKIEQPTLAQLGDAKQSTTLKTLSLIVKSLRCNVCELFDEKPLS